MPCTQATAILFYSQKAGGELDPLSEHGGCPVLGGVKWAAKCALGARATQR